MELWKTLKNSTKWVLSNGLFDILKNGAIWLITGGGIALMIDVFLKIFGSPFTGVVFSIGVIAVIFGCIGFYLQHRKQRPNKVLSALKRDFIPKDVSPILEQVYLGTVGFGDRPTNPAAHGWQIHCDNPNRGPVFSVDLSCPVPNAVKIVHTDRYSMDYLINDQTLSKASSVRLFIRFTNISSLYFRMEFLNLEGTQRNTGWLHYFPRDFAPKNVTKPKGELEWDLSMPGKLLTAGWKKARYY